MTHSDLSIRYDNAASGWFANMARLGYTNAYRDFLCRAVPKALSGGKVCDIGTGGGVFADALVKSGGAPDCLTLVDPSQQMLSEAAKLLRPQTRRLMCHCASLETFGPADRFNVVLASHVIEHCKQPQHALCKLWRLVAPGGRLVLVISRPHWCQWIIWLRWQHRWFSQARIIAMAANLHLPHPGVFRFFSGPPQRTSLGYVFVKPD